MGGPKKMTESKNSLDLAEICFPAISEENKILIFLEEKKLRKNFHLFPKKKQSPETSFFEFFLIFFFTPTLWGSKYL